MIAGIYNITCEQGSSFSRILEIEQPDLATDPTGQTYEEFDLTGYTARMQVRRTIESASAIVTLTTENLGLEINPVGGTTNSSGVYDLEIIDNGGFVSKVIKGAFTLILEVTR